MEVIESGYIGGTKNPFVLAQTDTVYASFAEGESAMAAMTPDPMLSSNTGTQVDNHIYRDIPNIWHKTVPGAPELSKIAMSGDLGFGFAVSDFIGNYNVITAPGYFSTNSYTRIHAPDLGAIYVAAKPNNRDVGLTFRQYSHESGERFYMALASDNRGWVYASKFGSLYFFLEKAGKVGYLTSGSNTYVQLADLEPLRLYVLQAAVATAQGTVYDPSGNPTEGCRVVAFDRETDRLVGRATTIHDGSYTMNLVALPGDSIYMVCLDNVELPDFEAQIIDRVTV